jgi:hypothetical protein
MARKTPQPRPVTVYLGKDKRERRIEELDRLAEKHGKGKLSTLIQRIADGELTLQENSKVAS